MIKLSSYEPAQQERASYTCILTFMLPFVLKEHTKVHVEVKEEKNHLLKTFYSYQYGGLFTTGKISSFF